MNNVQSNTTQLYLVLQEKPSSLDNKLKFYGIKRINKIHSKEQTFDNVIQNCISEQLKSNGEKPNIIIFIVKDLVSLKLFSQKWIKYKVHIYPKTLFYDNNTTKKEIRELQPYVQAIGSKFQEIVGFALNLERKINSLNAGIFFNQNNINSIQQPATHTNYQSQQNKYMSSISVSIEMEQKVEKKLHPHRYKNVAQKEQESTQKPVVQKNTEQSLTTTHMQHQRGQTEKNDKKEVLLQKFDSNVETNASSTIRLGSSQIEIMQENNNDKISLSLPFNRTMEQDNVQLSQQQKQIIVDNLQGSYPIQKQQQKLELNVHQVGMLTQAKQQNTHQTNKQINQLNEYPNQQQNNQLQHNVQLNQQNNQHRYDDYSNQNHDQQNNGNQNNQYNNNDQNKTKQQQNNKEKQNKCELVQQTNSFQIQEIKKEQLKAHTDKEQKNQIKTLQNTNTIKDEINIKSQEQEKMRKTQSSKIIIEKSNCSANNYMETSQYPKKLLKNHNNPTQVERKYEQNQYKEQQIDYINESIKKIKAKIQEMKLNQNNRHCISRERVMKNKKYLDSLSKKFGDENKKSEEQLNGLNSMLQNESSDNKSSSIQVFWIDSNGINRNRFIIDNITTMCQNKIMITPLVQFTTEIKMQISNNRDTQYVIIGTNTDFAAVFKHSFYPFQNVYKEYIYCGTQKYAYDNIEKFSLYPEPQVHTDPDDFSRSLFQYLSQRCQTIFGLKL